MGECVTVRSHVGTFLSSTVSSTEIHLAETNRMPKETTDEREAMVDPDDTGASSLAVRAIVIINTLVATK